MASSGTYLNLTLPDVGSTLGPTWATTLNDAFIDLDDHDHSTQGKSIPSAALNINADVEFNDFTPKELKQATFNAQASTYTPTGYDRSLYARTNDLYWYDGSNDIRLTRNGIIYNGSSYNLYNSTSTTTNISASNVYNMWAIISTGSRTVNLPSASDVGGGRFYIIKEAAGDATTITINASGTDTIDGGTAGGSIAISTTYGHVWLVSADTKWYRVQN